MNELAPVSAPDRIQMGRCVICLLLYRIHGKKFKTTSLYLDLMHIAFYFRSMKKRGGSITLRIRHCPGPYQRGAEHIRTLYEYCEHLEIGTLDERLELLDHYIYLDSRLS